MTFWLYWIPAGILGWAILRPAVIFMDSRPLDDYGWRRCLDRICSVTLFDLVLLIPAVFCGWGTLFAGLLMSLIIGLASAVVAIADCWEARDWPGIDDTIFRICPRRDE